MFELIRLQNPEVERIAYPVFLIDGKLDHTIENLRWYIKELAQK
ncbi:MULTISPECIES: hypothetical protein [Flavobacteriaceae]|nr:MULTISPECIES: hypothetical protein [Allomuricauda]MDC6366450.1 hypothetical protein [Muricauda sp. AC10]